MTIPEASQLVMQAGFMAKDGELFVLDMGKPVKIYDLAYNMIKLSGFTPNEDIKIEEIGLRPGEKLYEELLIKTEHLEKTDNKKIFIEQIESVSREQVEEKLAILKKATDSADVEAVKEAICATVPTYMVENVAAKEIKML
jgi:FlaA1/EpsC-like NDP-sugar epimerase